MNEIDKESKIKQYQTFIDDKLKVDLKEIEQELNKKFDKYKEWEELKNIACMLQEMKEKNLNMQVPVGYNVFVNAEINNSDTLLVNIGLGYLLEMNYIETEKYCNIRMNLLKKEINHYRKLAAQVKVKIKLTLLAVNELQSG